MKMCTKERKESKKCHLVLTKWQPADITLEKGCLKRNEIFKLNRMYIVKQDGSPKIFFTTRGWRLRMLTYSDRMAYNILVLTKALHSTQYNTMILTDFLLSSGH